MASTCPTRHTTKASVPEPRKCCETEGLAPSPHLAHLLHQMWTILCIHLSSNIKYVQIVQQHALHARRFSILTQMNTHEYRWQALQWQVEKHQFRSTAAQYNSIWWTCLAMSLSKRIQSLQSPLMMWNSWPAARIWKHRSGCPHDEASSNLHCKLGNEILSQTRGQKVLLHYATLLPKLVSPSVFPSCLGAQPL